MEEVGEMLFTRAGEERVCCVLDHDSSTGSAYEEDEKARKDRRK